jgi:ATP-dependent Clp protease protease subunit
MTIYTPSSATVYPPYIIERSSRGEKSYDVFSRLLMDRIVFLGAPINDDVANIVMAIYDTMQFLRAPVNTICMGMAASMGSFLLAAGSRGKRRALPHARIMIHQPSAGYQGTAADIEIQAKEVIYLRDQLNHLYAEHTGRDTEQIEKDIDRDRFMSADEAKEYGLIDDVIVKMPKEGTDQSG